MPNELIDAARVDGMPEIGIYVRIVLPLVSGALAALGILITLSVWNDYLWPLIILQDVGMYTLQVGITYAATTYEAESISDWTLIMTRDDDCLGADAAAGHFLSTVSGQRDHLDRPERLIMDAATLHKDALIWDAHRDVACEAPIHKRFLQGWMMEVDMHLPWYVRAASTPRSMRFASPTNAICRPRRRRSKSWTAS